MRSFNPHRSAEGPSEAEGAAAANRTHRTRGEHVTIPPVLDLTVSNDRDADAPQTTYPPHNATPNETTDGSPITPPADLGIYARSEPAPPPAPTRKLRESDRRSRAGPQQTPTATTNASTHFYTKKMGEATRIAATINNQHRQNRKSHAHSKQQGRFVAPAPPRGPQPPAGAGAGRRDHRERSARARSRLWSRPAAAHDCGMMAMTVAIVAGDGRCELEEAGNRRENGGFVRETDR